MDQNVFIKLNYKRTFPWWAKKQPKSNRNYVSFLLRCLKNHYKNKTKGISFWRYFLEKSVLEPREILHQGAFA